METSGRAAILIQEMRRVAALASQMNLEGELRAALFEPNPKQVTIILHLEGFNKVIAFTGLRPKFNIDSYGHPWEVLDAYSVFWCYYPQPQ